MTHPTFHIPTTGLYLQPDGSLTPQPEPGAAVVEADEAVAGELTAAYVGHGLQLMSQSGGLTKADVASQKALKKMEEAAEAIVLIGEVVELGIALGEWMGLIEAEKDPVLAELERFDQQLNRIDDFALAAWSSSRREQLTLLRSHSSTAIHFAQQYMELNRP
jgi:hypothetical protein